MSIDLHTVAITGGSTLQWTDRLVVGLQKSLANAAGSAGAAVTTAVAFVANSLPPAYSVFIEVSQPGVFASVSNKTANGFSVVLTPLAGQPVAAGNFSVLVIA